MAGKRWTMDEIRKFRQMYYNGSSYEEIAEKVGKSKTAVKQFASLQKKRQPRFGARKKDQKGVRSSCVPSTYCESICWLCANAVPDQANGKGCPWSERFAPVEGWVIRQGKRTKHDGTIEASCCVISCPKFEEG